MSIFPQLDMQDYPDLEAKGYWFIYSYDRVLGGKYINQPLNKKGQYINLAELIYLLILLFLFFFWVFIDIRMPDMSYTYGLIILGGFFVPFIIRAVFLHRKTYYPGSSRFKAQTTGNTDSFYNSDENLYTTSTEGIYVCSTCETPIGTTDDREKVSGQIISLKKLMFETQDKSIICPNCLTELGQRSDFSNLYELKGETLLLDAGGLHHIYPK